jgi:hypothetical protein
VREFAGPLGTGGEVESHVRRRVARQTGLAQHGAFAWLADSLVSSATVRSKEHSVVIGPMPGSSSSCSRVAELRWTLTLGHCARPRLRAAYRPGAPPPRSGTTTCWPSASGVAKLSRSESTGVVFTTRRETASWPVSTRVALSQQELPRAPRRGVLRPFCRHGCRRVVSQDTESPRLPGGFPRWAVLGSNQRPPACRYGPGVRACSRRFGKPLLFGAFRA